MIMVSLIFFAFISMNIIINSAKAKNTDEYMEEMQKQLCEELKIIK